VPKEAIVRLRARGPISGRVVGPGGRRAWAVEARVDGSPWSPDSPLAAFTDQGWVPAIFLSTDDDGTFRFGDLPGVAHSLRVVHLDPAVFRSEPVHARPPDADVTLRVVAVPESERRDLVVDTSPPAEGPYWRAAWYGADGAEQHTGAYEGRFTFRGLASSGQGTVVVLRRNRPEAPMALRTPVDAAAGTVRLYLESPCVIRGRIRGQPPLPGYDGWVEARGPHGFERHTASRPDGGFSIEGLPRGTYAIVAHLRRTYPKGQHTLRETRIESVPAGTDDLVVDLRLAADAE
jgi:hypothetical protein